MAFPRKIGPWTVKDIIKISNCLIVEVTAPGVLEDVILKIKITDYSLKPEHLEFNAALAFTNLIPTKYSWAHVLGVIEIPGDYLRAEFPAVTAPLGAFVTWMAMYKGVPAQYDIKIYDDVCTQLSKIHHSGYYHGDIKCNNIIKYNGQYTLIDFECTHAKATYDAQIEDNAQKLYNVVMGFGDRDGMRSFKFEKRGLLISIINLKYPSIFKPIYCAYDEMLKSRFGPADINGFYDLMSSAICAGLEEKNDSAMLEQLNFLSRYV